MEKSSKGLGQPLAVSVCTRCGFAGHAMNVCPETHPELVELEVLVEASRVA